jgi:hypothetical protein
MTEAEEIQTVLAKIRNEVGEPLKQAQDKIGELQARLQEVEQKQLVRSISPAALATGRFGNTAGDEVVKQFQEHGAQFGRNKSLRLECLKAATDAITTGGARNLVSGGAGMPGAGVLGIQNAFPQRNATGTSAVEYSRFTGVQGTATVQAGEGAPKSAVKIDHALIQQSSITVAGFSKMSRQGLNDASELKKSVDVTLARACAKALDIMLNAGNVTPAFEGLLALATPVTSLIYTPLVDAVSEGAATMQLAGFVPDVVAFGPADWLAIVTAKSTTGEYLSGSYLGALPESLRGLRPVLSPSLTAGKAMLLDSGQLELLIVDGFAVELGYTGDDFTNNLVTLLGELRVIPIVRAADAVLLVTAKAA